MISINKNEKIEIQKKYPDAHVVRTMKTKSKRHHYFVEETMAVLKCLSQIRGVEWYNL